MKNLSIKLKKWFFRILILIIVLLSVSLNFKQCSDLKQSNNNVIALSDTLKITKNKLGETVVSNGVLMLNIEELSKTNSSLNEEVNKLSKKDKKNLVEISKMSIEINNMWDNISEILTPDTTIKLNDSTSIYTYPIQNKNEYRDFQGSFKVTSKQKPIKTEFNILSDKIFADITIGKKKNGDNIEIFASSSNPYIKINQLENSVIDLTAYNKFQKPKLFGLGINIGYGISTNNGLVYLSPYVGIGLSYNLIKW